VQVEGACCSERLDEGCGRLWRMGGPILDRTSNGMAFFCRRWRTPPWTSAATKLAWFQEGPRPSHSERRPCLFCCVCVCCELTIGRSIARDVRLGRETFYLFYNYFIILSDSPVAYGAEAGQQPTLFCYACRHSWRVLEENRTMPLLCFSCRGRG
jgi:hypothetical protein